MSNRLIKIEKENLGFAWIDVRPYLERALANTPEYSLLDVFEGIKGGTETLWVFYNDKKKEPFGAMVTELYEYPQKRILNIFLMASDNWQDVIPLWSELVKYASLVGASSIECAGRFGLEKLLSSLGFKKSYIVMDVDVN